MCDSGIFTETATDRIHRNYKLRIIVFYGGKVTKLPFDRVRGSEQIGNLNIYPIVCLGSNKVYLPGTKNTDRNVKALSPEMVPHHIFHSLFNTAPDIRSAKIIADTMVRKIVFVIRFKEHFAMDIKTPDRNCEVCVIQIFQII